MNDQNSIIKESIEKILYILNHRSNVSVNGQPPYSPLPEETVELLNKNLKRLKNDLAEYEKVQKEDLKNFIIPDEIKISRDKPKWREPILLEHIPIVVPILLEHIPIVVPIRFEHIPIVVPKLWKIRPHKKSDGWKQANKNPRGPVCRY